MDNCRQITRCRVCGSYALDLVLDLGTQHLAGQFPLLGEPDPPAFPLTLVRCASGCGAVQLAHTVEPSLMFKDYWYRSGVSQTMTDHLKNLAEEAIHVLGRIPQKVLDIGCNDGTLLCALPRGDGFNTRYGIDPCDVPNCNDGIWFGTRGSFPQDMRNDVGPFDLIFTVACFYDADDPVVFARAVRDNLTPTGVWCLEVAHLPAMLAKTAYDSIVHEHLLYYDCISLGHVLRAAGLQPIARSTNGCNGGSLRVYAVRDDYWPSAASWREQQVIVDAWAQAEAQDLGWSNSDRLKEFAERVRSHRIEFQDYLLEKIDSKKTMHLLGASTKFNTVLQYCNAGMIDAASDRDPRKAGRKCPGTGIPILSEEESRARKPDIYLTALAHFRDELVAREQEYLKAGGKIAFVLPHVEEVGA